MPNLGPDIMGYHVYCWSNEQNPLEPVHLHIARKQIANATKIWIRSDGTTQVENNNSQIPERQLRRICQIIERDPMSYVKRWEKHFNVEARFIDCQ